MSRWEQEITAWDRDAFQTINEGLKSPSLDLVLPHISDLGLGYVQAPFIIGLAVLTACVRRQVRRQSLLRDGWRAVVVRRWAVTLLLAFAVAGIGSILFKKAISRDRPWWYYYHEHQAGRALTIRVELSSGRKPLKTRGFVSGHTATSFALATAATGLFWRRRRLWPAVAGCWILACLIGLSRIYIGDHWPLDVISGALVGLISGAAAVYLLRERRLPAADAMERVPANG